jgi:hypothetical protein
MTILAALLTARCRNVRSGKPAGKKRWKKLGAEPLRALPLSDPSERGGGGTDESAATHKS